MVGNLNSIYPTTNMTNYTVLRNVLSYEVELLGEHYKSQLVPHFNNIFNYNFDVSTSDCKKEKIVRNIKRLLDVEVCKYKKSMRNAINKEFFTDSVQNRFEFEELLQYSRLQCYKNLRKHIKGHNLLQIELTSQSKMQEEHISSWIEKVDKGTLQIDVVREEIDEGFEESFTENDNGRPNAPLNIFNFDWIDSSLFFYNSNAELVILRLLRFYESNDDVARAIHFNLNL